MKIAGIVSDCLSMIHFKGDPSTNQGVGRSNRSGRTSINAKPS